MMRTISSGVKGLDEVLGGGFFRPSVVLIAGGVGTGKTTLALQILFNAARTGRKCLFIASISEPITAINRFLSSFSFFNPDLETIHFADAGEAFMAKEDVFSFIRENIDIIKPEIVVIDSFLSITENKEDLLSLFSYIKRRNILLLLTEVFTKENLNEHYIASLVDGVIFLDAERGRRNLSVLKMRGRAISTKKHAFKFTSEGIEVFPKLSIAETKVSERRVNIGVKGIEHVLGDGGSVLEGSIILVTGEAGTGKTLFGFHFIQAGIEKGEKGLIISLNEDKPTLERNARHFGFDFKGLLKILSVPLIDLIPDEHLIKIKEELKGVKRVVVDGFPHYIHAFDNENEYKIFMRTLISLCRSEGITSIFIGNTAQGAHADIAHLADGIIILSSEEEMGVKRRFIEIVKMRGSAHTIGKKLCDITPNGLEISP